MKKFHVIDYGDPDAYISFGDVKNLEKYLNSQNFEGCNVLECVTVVYGVEVELKTNKVTVNKESIV